MNAVETENYNNAALDIFDTSPQVHPQDFEFERTQFSEENFSSADSSYLALLPLLLRLDQRIALAVTAAEHMFASRAAGDLYRGLAISPADIAAVLKRIPGEPFTHQPLQAQATAELSDSLSTRRLLWLQRVFGLSDVDLDIIVVGLAPEIDLRYERLYAYLQDDVSKRRPSIDLALNLLSTTGSAKLENRNRFAPDAPLTQHRLIEIYGEQQNRAPLLAKFFKLDEQIVRFLLLDDSLDSRLAHFCNLLSPHPKRKSAPIAEEFKSSLNKLAEVKPNTGLRIYFEGNDNSGQDEAVALLASALELRVLQADMSKFGGTPTELNDVTPILVREAWLRSAVLHCKSLLNSDEINTADKYVPLWSALREIPANCVVQGEAAWQPSAQKPQGVMTFTFAFPDSTQRKQWWHSCLSEAGAVLNDEDLTTLAHRFKLTFAQIEDATKVCINNSLATQESTATENSIQLNKNLIAAARTQSGHELLTLADKIIPKATWDDLILNDDAKAQLTELCNRAIYRERVLQDWGFAKKLARGLGTAALFSGGSGTGKTMAAEVIANTLGLDLYRIDLARIVNKYVGETEKNLNRIFSAAENANAILFFDEADALFGKRSEVKDGHDHYANLQVSHLLQKMEDYDGLAILATNLSDNMDQAFTRRLAFSIHFPFPDEIYRLHMWQRALPDTTPRAEDLDLPLLAKELKLSGGNIKNIGLAAAFLAAAEGDVVTMRHLIRAAERECQKLGKVMVVKLRGQ
ncbi:MAG: ATP-binding protein [Pseudomonadota bacterium]